MGTGQHSADPNLRGGQVYTSSRDIEHALLLMLGNALLYNSPTHFVHQAASKMCRDGLVALKEFEKTMKSVDK